VAGRRRKRGGTGRIRYGSEAGRDWTEAGSRREGVGTSCNRPAIGP
jgi:hypothetical protein